MAYKLNNEVENPPQALQKASQIGVLKFFNENLKNLPDKKVVVILTFGTTLKSAREKNILPIVQEIQKNYPHEKIFTAFTSHIVRKNIAKREGFCEFFSPEEILQKLLQENFNCVAIVSLSLIPGIEYKYNVELFHEYKKFFKKISLSTPLIYWQGQKNQPDDVTEVLQNLNLPPKMPKTAIFLMTHGTPDPANAYYSVMQEKVNFLRDDVYIYTVEGFPSIFDAISRAKKNCVEKIFLLPFMLAAGNHVVEDMNVLHRKILLENGFDVEIFLQGLGENEKIREIYLNRAKKAVEALNCE